MKTNLLTGALMLIVAILSLALPANCVEGLRLENSGMIKLASASSSNNDSARLPYYKVVQLADGRLFVAYEKLTGDQVSLVTSLRSQKDDIENYSVTLRDTNLLKSMSLILDGKDIILICRFPWMKFKVYRFKIDGRRFSIKKTQVSSEWEGENLFFYPEFGAATVNGTTWMCIADSTDDKSSGNSKLPTPPLPKDGNVTLNWFFLSGNKIWKVGTRSLKSKVEIGKPVNMCWLPDQRLVTTFGRQILSYNISEKQVSEINPSFVSEETNWFSIAARGRNQVLAVSTDTKKQSSLLLIDVGSRKRIASVMLPQDVPVEHSTTTLSQRNKKYLLSYLPYSSRLVPDAGPHGASVPYYTYTGIKLTEVSIK